LLPVLGVLRCSGLCGANTAQFKLNPARNNGTKLESTARTHICTAKLFVSFLFLFFFALWR
jgi:hypothetical protein